MPTTRGILFHSTFGDSRIFHNAEYFTFCKSKIFHSKQKSSKIRKDKCSILIFTHREVWVPPYVVSKCALVFLITCFSVAKHNRVQNEVLCQHFYKCFGLYQFAWNQTSIRCASIFHYFRYALQINTPHILLRWE